jgi:hypothetical protein
MDKLLADFAEAYDDLQRVREGFTLHKERWYAWNYWAQHHGKFSLKEWMNENDLEFSDIQAKTNYPEADIVRNREEGYRYYSAWRGAQQAKTDAETTFDRLFEMLWLKRDTQGQLVYSNEELGSVIGKDGDGVRKFAAKRSWYQPRGRKGKHKC